jgi:hypothetical protein
VHEFIPDRCEFRGWLAADGCIGRQLKAEDLCRRGGGHRPQFEVAKTVLIQKAIGAARKASFPTTVEPSFRSETQAK